MLLLFCNVMIAIAMGIFAYEMYRETKLVQSVIFAAISIVIFTFVIVSFVYKRKLQDKEQEDVHKS
ncbi:hypothetical protein FOI68_04015 [Brevibacillus sp. LEMMJ03]|nr:hypothetical protein [Anoxybacillus sp. LAT_38]MCG6197947.1 hypothetical protein [Anoxybacillus sp. LAT_38]TRY27532.1 hypothetical protein FOI68_04015 [Brevibacillus sp. LEMMJ03]